MHLPFRDSNAWKCLYLASWCDRGRNTSNRFSQIGCICDAQIVNQGKILLPTDHELPEDLEPSRYNKKLERLASFRQLQAISQMSEQFTGRRLSDYEAIRHGLHLSPMTAGQFRYIIKRATTQDAWIVNSDNGSYLHRVLPVDLPEIFPQVTSCEDQCFVNSA